ASDGYVHRIEIWINVNTLQHREGGSDHCGVTHVERHSQKRPIVLVDDVAAWKIVWVAALLNQGPPLPGLERQRGEAGLVATRALLVGEENDFSAGKRIRPPMIQFAAPRVRTSQDFGRTASGRDTLQTLSPVRIEDNGPIWQPGGAVSQLCCVAQDDRRPTRHRNFSQLPSGEESKPLAIWCEEGKGRSFGTRQGLALKGSNFTDGERVRVALAHNERYWPAIRGKRDLNTAVC